MDEVSKPRGRPSEFSQEIADRICAEIASGDSLRTICKADEMPSVVTLFNWLRRYPEFLKQYETAKAEQADAMAEEMLDIADNGLNDWVEVHGEENEAAGWRLNGEHVQRSRLRIDTRKWLASKLKAKKYGDKVIHAGDADAPAIKHDLTHDLSDKLAKILTDAQLAELAKTEP